VVYNVYYTVCIVILVHEFCLIRHERLQTLFVLLLLLLFVISLLFVKNTALLLSGKKIYIIYIPDSRYHSVQYT